MPTDIATFLAHAVALEQEAAERYAELADAIERDPVDRHQIPSASQQRHTRAWRSTRMSSMNWIQAPLASMDSSTS